LTELRATYRLQLTADFGFSSARELVPYLSSLGVSHLYLSPSLEARPGSTHGYDVIDPRRVSSALGGEDELRALSAAAREAGMGIVLDTVPNHMATDDANPFWSDPALRERFFDIDPVTGRHRRFFDIDDLAGVRQEDPSVFEATHELVLSLVDEGVVDGLRIDHPDGLADPAGYLAALRGAGVERVWIEKILDPGEHLREWPVSGTVGYEFMNDLTALFVDPAGEAPLTALWEEISGDRRPFGEVAREAKLEQVRGPFVPEVERLSRLIPALERGELESALASLPIYRTYVEARAGVVDGADRSAVEEARMAEAIARVVLFEDPAAPAEFVTRFQQTTPAIMAKGVEDTAFYRYGRLLALNDVGGDPSRFSIDVERFHARCLERAERFPLNLLTTMTHDAKRSHDVRARIGAIASIPGEWAGHVRRWFELTEALREGGAPDDVERYFLFQTLVGAWPIASERLGQYMVKALREAKRNTSWIDQNSEWEAAVGRFCQALYADREFLEEFEPFAARLAALGDRAALGQLALKLTAPGVPDIYQGDELPFRALVDPDNRRPVDWDRRRETLAALRGGAGSDAANRKQWLIWRLLALRAARPEAFAGSYEPLDAGGAACAYVRGGDLLVVVALRPEGVMAGDLIGAPGGSWRDVLGRGERSFGPREALSGVLEGHAVAVFQRPGR
jgi:(1->4)-alpha-D-glucan 1-alpha-D-glucosylmutase